ncbi:MAG: hypothetical protein MUC67_07760, partial [Acidobacteria bacterium]|nr:hypothetical protein [Acidobacteriota bacterium]
EPARPSTRDVKPEPARPTTREAARPSGGGDRGYEKPQARPAPAPDRAKKSTGFATPSGGGSSDRAASSRGKQSMKGGKSGGGQGGAKSAPQKKAR